MARPSGYTEELGAKICERIASGETLVTVCKSAGMPTVSTVLRWNLSDEQAGFASFRELYARAKEIRLEVMAEELRHISDTCRVGKKTERKHVAWVCPACRGDARWIGKRWMHSVDSSPLCAEAKKPEEVTENKTVTADMVERAKLQVDTRKWLLSRLAARVYGDRAAVELSGPGGGPLQITRVVIEDSDRENSG